jgi:hypothetical protein
VSRTVSLARPPIHAGAAVGDDAPKFDTRALIVWAVRSDQRFNSNADGGYRGKRVMAALENAKRSVTFEHPEWEALREALTDPRPIPGSWAYPVSPVHLILPFIEDVRDAPEASEKVVKGKRR